MWMIILAVVCVALAIAVTYFLARVRSMKTLFGITKEQLDEVSKKNDELVTENGRLNAECKSRDTEIGLLMKQSEKEQAERDEQFAKQLKLVEEQLKNATQDILKQREEDLRSTNKEQMDVVVKPLKDTMDEVKKSMADNRDTHNRNTAALEKSIEDMMKRTTEIGMEADKLASALRNESKTQGNWGELVLQELLESQGLEAGVHFDVQSELKDAEGRPIISEDTGRRMIPDVILHFPDGKDAIIDSKVSLSAFVDYQNATDEVSRSLALKKHIESVTQHVNELARKDYSRNIAKEHQLLDYVIMFIPNESALQLVLNNDSGLWRSAFEKGVFITSGQNLIAALHMIQMAWTQVKQAQNQERIYGLVSILLDRIGDFVQQFDDVGTKLDKAKETFDSCMKKVYTGQQSVVGSANKLIELGGKDNPKRPVPSFRPELPGEK
jgi:DNA recombination protein RmuC